MLPDLIASQIASLGALVLMPGQLRLPTEGGRGGSDRGGLTAFLAKHDGRYIQIETPEPISTDGLLDVFWTSVAAVASTAQACALLGHEIRTALAGTPRAPGQFDVAIPDLPREIQTGVWMLRATFSTALLAGFIPA